MKIITAISSALIALFSLSATAAEQGLYTRLDSGYSWSSDADSSAIAGVGVGYRFNDHVRGDITLGYRGWYNASESATVAGTTLSGSSDIKSTDGLVNAYYDIGRFGSFTPYIGGGVGVAYNHAGSADVALNGTNVGQIGSDNHTNFAWQLGAGTAINLSDNFAFDVGYRYIDLGSAETSDTFTALNGTTTTGVRQTANIRGSEVQAGLRYSF